MFDYISIHPRDELLAAVARTPAVEYASFYSIKGRMVCFRRIFLHGMGIILKPSLYLVAGTTQLLMLLIVKDQEPYKSNKNAYLKDWGIRKRVFFCTFTAPFGQLILTSKAALGVIYPKAYFKEDALHPYFIRLSEIAKEAGGTASLVDLLKNGSTIIEKNMKQNVSRKHYYALYERDLKLMCEKFSQLDFPKAKTVTFLNMLLPDPADTLPTGLNSCPPGLGRLFEQICAVIDIPLNHGDLVPWLTAQFKEEIINKMILGASTTSKETSDSYIKLAMNNLKKKEEKVLERIEWHKAIEHLAHDPAHRANGFIANFGSQIGLPQKMIDQAAFDPTLNPVTEHQRLLILSEFTKLCNQTTLLQFLQTHINSNIAGEVGLKTFREYVIQRLAETVRDEELQAAKEEIMRCFHISSDMAHDPVYFVRLKYLLYPNSLPQDPKHTDLNENGIRAFAATLSPNPLTNVAV